MQDRINVVLSRVFDLSVDETKRDLTKDDVAKWDSLTHMDLVTTLEREFQVILNVDEIISMTSLDVIRKIIAAKVGNNE